MNTDSYKTTTENVGVSDFFYEMVLNPWRIDLYKEWQRNKDPKTKFNTVRNELFAELNVVGFSDSSVGSQMDELNNDAKVDIKAKYLGNVVLLAPDDMEKFEAAIKNKNTDDVYLSHTVGLVKKKLETNDELCVLEDWYSFVLKLHMYHKYIFDPSYARISEADYLAKVWLPLFEVIFRVLWSAFFIYRNCSLGRDEKPTSETRQYESTYEFVFNY